VTPSWPVPLLCERAHASVEVLHELIGPRPLLARHHEIDVAAAKPVERVIGGALGLDAHASELVAPSEGGRLLLEGGDRLPVLEARVCDQDRRLARAAAVSKPSRAHDHSLRLPGARGRSVREGGLRMPTRALHIAALVGTANCIAILSLT